VIGYVDDIYFCNNLTFNLIWNYGKNYIFWLLQTENGINLINKTSKMKKSLLLAISAALASSSLMAGGIMTNTNQSAGYARTVSRNASLGIDAVYFNPAGLTKLGNGFHLSLNNQSIFQTKDVINNYPYLNGTPTTFVGDVKAMVFPGVYAVYKMDKLAFSFGFNPVGGGGGATYATGLPSFEIPISDLVPSLAASSGVTHYQTDINFEGSSIYLGYQLGVSYEINPSISLFAGIRTVTADNTYKGTIKNIAINPTIANTVYAGQFVKAKDFGTERATYYTGVSNAYTGAANGAGSLVAAGLGSYTYAQAFAAGAINATQKAQFEGALVAAGQPANTPIGTSQVVYTTVAGQAKAGATQMTGLAAGTGDKEVDAVQKGTGYTPIFGANLTLAEKLTVAIKYELATKIVLKNETKIDQTGAFPDSAESRCDMPAMLAIGVSYPVTQKLVASLSFNYYWDKKADYGRKDENSILVTNDAVIDNNLYEFGLGLEYNFTEKFLLSAGFLNAKTGVSKAYQTDLSYSLSSNTAAFGGQYKISPAVALNLGALYTMYSDDDKTYNHKLGTNLIPVTETYSKTNWLVAVGLDIKIGK
jgi:long-subunit fatty acid transport protein